jgi:F0F1-type ATP synthase assembly protein I
MPRQGFQHDPTPPFKKVEEYGSLLRQTGTALAIPGLLLAGPLVGFGLGWCIKTYLGGPGWSPGVGLIVGLISGIRESIIVIKKLSREADRKLDE